MYCYDYEKIVNDRNQIEYKKNSNVENLRDIIKKYFIRLGMYNLKSSTDVLNIENAGIYYEKHDFFKYLKEFNEFLKQKTMSFFVLNEESYIIYKNTEYFEKIYFSINDKLVINNIGIFSFHLSKDNKNINFVLGAEHYLDIFKDIYDFCIPFNYQEKNYYFMFLGEITKFDVKDIKSALNIILNMNENIKSENLNTKKLYKFKTLNNSKIKSDINEKNIFPIILYLNSKNEIIEKVIDNSNLFDIGINFAKVFNIFNLNRLKKYTFKTIIDNKEYSLLYEVISIQNDLRLIKLSEEKI